METRVIAKDVCVVMEDDLNKEIIKWWHQLPDNLKGNMPTFIHQLNKNADILFVGLNPSGDIMPKAPITKISNKDIQEKIYLETRAIFGNGRNRDGQYKKYYKSLSNIADELGLEYEHYDLFQMSYRKAKDVVEELINAEKKLKLIHSNHLSVFTKVFNYVSPKIVITNNMNTANILKVYLGLYFDNDKGLYRNEKGTYFYLNGIMSYGRQTIYDKERLIWLLQRIL